MELTGSNPNAVSRVRANSVKNYYEILQVDQNVSRVQIREAFLRLKKTYSAGSQALYSLMDEDEARRSMVEIEEAFRILDDDHLRREYDLRLKNGDIGVGATARGGDELNWGGAGDLISDTLDSSTAFAKRTPTLCKVSPRLMDADMRRQVDELQQGSELGDGLLYKQIRDMTGITIQEIYSHTKISPEYLQAIENNDFPKLPALVYIKGFLRSYLRFIGINDTAAAIRGFTERYEAWENNTDMVGS